MSYDPNIESVTLESAELTHSGFTTVHLETAVAGVACRVTILEWPIRGEYLPAATSVHVSGLGDDTRSAGGSTLYEALEAFRALLRV